MSALRILAACALIVAGAAHAASEKEVIQLYRQAAGAMAPARAELERLAKDGDGLAAHFLGRLHLEGRGVLRDETAAVEWFRKSAELGRADSAHNLGVIYERSRGTLKDAKEARRWYGIAADKGYARAQSNLGHMLAEGHGGPADLDQAKYWYEKAAAQGDPRGRYLLGMLTLEGRAGIARNEAEAVRLIRLAAEDKEREAQYRMALLYGTGQAQGVKRDDKLALEWLRKSAAQRLPEAELLLGAVHARGLYGVKRDPKAAVGWLRKSALQGNVEAMYGLGLAYAEGRGVEKDPTEAYGWMLHAARNGHPQAIAFVRRIQELRPPPKEPAGKDAPAEKKD